MREDKVGPDASFRIAFCRPGMELFAAHRASELVVGVAMAVIFLDPLVAVAVEQTCSASAEEA